MGEFVWICVMGRFHVRVDCKYVMMVVCVCEGMRTCVHHCMQWWRVRVHMRVCVTVFHSLWSGTDT